MTFWSGARIHDQLQLIIDNSPLPKVDCNAVELTMGPEVYITPHLEVRDPQSVTKRKLDDGECFTIPAGQFAFLLTEETIKIPHTAMAFISMKTTIKFKGLVNVSGFHVDPGYKGRLVFSVFNAGPAPVHLQRGKPVFMLWLADLDNQATEKDGRSNGNNEIPSGMSEIPLKLINNIPGEIYSLQSLSKRIDGLEKDVGLISTKTKIWIGIAGVVIAILLRTQIANELGILWHSLSR